MKSYKLGILITFIMIVLSMSGCAKSNNDLDNQLDPDKPITVTVWHYYNGGTKEAFDALVSKFNETIGVEKGFVVESQSQGDVSQLANAVFDAANEYIGSSPMPDIFASYPDNTYRVNQIVDLVSLDEYFSAEELSEYRDEFLDEGRFLYNNEFFIVPIAKSSENLFVNKTDWVKFADENSFTNEDLSTWEGLYNVSKTYYEQTGRGFFSIDATANFMLESAMQLGTEMYIYENDGTVKFNFTKEVAKNVWDYYYRPYLKGYFVKTGRFSSDDAKIGTILAYTGSTAGVAYFPKEVTIEQKTVYPIELLALPYPYYEDGQPYAIQQGAGMSITRSDVAHEYAASMFLKWFTDKKQNTKFAVTTGYFPVKNESINNDEMLNILMENDINNPSIEASIITTNKMFKEYTLYNSKPFRGSYEMRNLLENNLYGKLLMDLESLNSEVDEGNSRDDIIKEMISDEAFENWYKEMFYQSDLIMNK